MSTADAEANKAPTEASHATVVSPERPRPQAQPPKGRSLGPIRTERPTQVIRDSSAYALPQEDTALGNLQAIMSLRAEGKLGLFYPRNLTASRPTHVTIQVENFRSSAYRLILAVLNQESINAKPAVNAALTMNIPETASQLTSGVCIMLYLRLQSVNCLDSRVADRYRERPMVPAHFQVPSPFALAITQLGQIKLSELPEEIYLSPTIPADAAVNFCLPEDDVWKPVEYAKAVANAKILGLQFSDVDLESKLGSSWWLYRPVQEDDEFRLECPYPEENFTLNTTILAALFCNNNDDGFLNPIIDLDAIGTAVFCSLLRYPPEDISLNVYYAITETPEVVYLFSD